MQTGIVILALAFTSSPSVSTGTGSLAARFEPTAVVDPETEPPDEPESACAKRWPVCQAAGAVVGTFPGTLSGAFVGAVGGGFIFAAAAAERGNGPASDVVSGVGGDFWPFLGICTAGGALLGAGGGAVTGWIVADDLVE